MQFCDAEPLLFLKLLLLVILAIHSLENKIAKLFKRISVVRPQEILRAIYFRELGSTGNYLGELGSKHILLEF